jgi:hypothetical protein
MKVFAILTACLMTAAGTTYYLTSSDSGCPFGGCPVASSGGCCATDTTAAKPDCCVTPCPACAIDCRECCAVCEQCCAAGAQVTAPAPAVSLAANVGEEEECCAACRTPAKLATSAVIAGVTLK